MSVSNNLMRHSPSESSHPVNISSWERWAMAIGGGALVACGIKKRSFAGSLISAMGAGLIHDGLNGHCELYHLMGINTAKEGDEMPVARDVHVQAAIVIDQPPHVIYEFWRNFENLPLFMDHLDSVTRIDDVRSHWVAKGPVGRSLEWDAEIYNEKEDELISWRSLPESEFVNAGTVRFEPAGTLPTLVRVVMNFNVPGGRLAAEVVPFLKELPRGWIEQDLNRLKRILETGAVSDIGEDEHGRDQAAGAHGGKLMGRAHSQL
jgi:uncharacterized membrane protein